MTKITTIPDNYNNIRAEIVELLKAARSTAARNVNSIMTATYWEIGRRIVEQELRGEARANYGEQLLELLAKDLTKQFGRGFGNINLWRMRAFYRAWSEGQILSTLSKESGKLIAFNNISPLSSSISTLSAGFPLPWSAYVRLLGVKRPEARLFYESEALRSGWSVRQLDRQIGSQFYERIALSQNKAAMLEKARDVRTQRRDDARRSNQGPVRPRIPRPQGRILRVGLGGGAHPAPYRFPLGIGRRFCLSWSPAPASHRRHMVSHRPRFLPSPFATCL